jgi:photosystem II stability/assembly factor-like uncharacterized protein
MKYWASVAGVVLGASLMSMSASRAEPGATAATPKSGIVVKIKSDRIILNDITSAGQRLVTVGERGFALVSDDAGKSWKAVETPVDRTLTGVAFKDAKVGIAVGHGGVVVRTDDGGNTWTRIPLEAAGTDSLLGIVHLAGDHFVAYGSFGLYVDSVDAGKTWQKHMVVSEDFDRHISQVLPYGQSLFMVAESGTLARSDDDGATWTLMTSPYEGSYFAALATRDGALLAFGMRGHVYRSTDFGVTWQQVEVGTTASLMAGKQLADGRILLVGNSGLLAVSNDDGRTLAVHWAPDAPGFAALTEVGDKVILVGERGVMTMDPSWLTDQKTTTGH